MRFKVIAALCLALLLAGSCTLGEGTGPAPAEAYTVYVVDQNGDPVSDAFVSFCTDELCTIAQSDEAGVITFEGEPFAYHLDVVKLPEGYHCEPVEDLYTGADYGSLTLEVVKD